MRRILHLITTMPVGGAENLILTTIRQLDSARFSSTLCCIQDAGVLGMEALQEGIPVHALGLMKSKSFDRHAVIAIRELMQREKIDLVHCHLYHAALYGRLAAFMAGIPSVVTVHNIYSRVKWHRRMLNRWLGARTACVIAVSEAVGRDVRSVDSIPPDRLQVIPNGIDIISTQDGLGRDAMRQRLNLPANAFVIGTVGRLEPQKGHRFLLDAMATLRATHGDCPHLLIVGSGSTAEAIREQIQRQSLSDRVVLLGTRRDIPDILRTLDLFVLPSLWEGLPLALLEAMAAGVPVVASEVGGVGEVLGTDEFGIALPPGDVGALTNALQTLMLNRTLLEALGTRGAERVRERYNSSSMVKRLETIYEDACAPRQS